MPIIFEGKLPVKGFNLVDFITVAAIKDTQAIQGYLENFPQELTMSEEIGQGLISALECLGETERSHYGNILLIPAIIHNNVILIEYLTRIPNVSPATSSTDNRSALEIAVGLENIPALELLLTKTTYSLALDPSEIIFKAYSIALQNKNPDCIRLLASACLYKLNNLSQHDDIQELLRVTEFGDPRLFQDFRGDTILHNSVSYVGRTLHLILPIFYRLLDKKNVEGKTPLDTLSEFISASEDDIGYLYVANYKTILKFIYEKVKGIDISGSDSVLHIAELRWFASLLKKLTRPEAHDLKAKLYIDCQTEPVKRELLCFADINICFIEEKLAKDYLIEQASHLLAALRVGDVETVRHLLASGVNPNVYLEEGETPLTFSVKRCNPAMVCALMQAESINPDLPNQHGEIPAYLAYINKDVACFAAITMEPKTARYATTFAGIQFPVHGWVSVDLDDNQEVEMWEGLSAANYSTERYEAEIKMSLTVVADLKKFLVEQLSRLQSNSSAAARLLLQSRDSVTLDEKRAYYLTRHKNINFLADPGKRGERECQSAVLTLTGSPVGVFSHQVASPYGASIAYHFDSSKYLSGTKTDMNSVRLWAEQPPGVRQFADPANAIRILETTPKRAGNSIVRYRQAGSMKQRSSDDLSLKIRQMAERAHSPYYLSRKNLEKYGGEGRVERLKVNTSYLHFKKYGYLPYNEVLITTAAMVKGANPVSDISHIFLTETNGDFTLMSIMTAVLTQLELMLEAESNQYFPICHYSASEGHHQRISVTSLGFLTKLIAICIDMPVDCLNFNKKLSDLLPKGIDANEFFRSEHNAAIIEKMLFDACHQRFHSCPELSEIIQGGRADGRSFVSSEHEGEFVIHLPYTNQCYINSSVQRAMVSFCSGLQAVTHLLAVELFKKKPRPISFFPVTKAEVDAEFMSFQSSLYRLLHSYGTFQCSDISAGGNLVVKKVPTLLHWRNYWKEETSFPLTYLWNTLSVYLLNCPYEDEPDDFVTVPHVDGEQILYRLNHDASHAIRKLVMVNYIVALLRLFGRESIKDTLANVSAEELSLLQLVAFLERSGRTNEMAGIDDPSNAIRSGEIIIQIAKELDFNQTLVNSVCRNAINYSGVGLASAGFSAGQGTDMPQRKAELFYQLLTLSHHCDLGRCRAQGFEFVKALLEKSQELEDVVPSSNRGRVIETLLDFIQFLSKSTGTAILDHADDYTNLERKTQCVINTGQIIEKLTVASVEQVEFLVRDLESSFAHQP